MLAKLTADSVTTNPKRTFMHTRVRLIRCLFLIAASAVGLARIVAAEAKDGSNRVDGHCDPILLLVELFDGVTPPVLPFGWSSTTWVTSNSGVPTPPADTPPNAAFVDDPATISDKQLLSPTMVSLYDWGRVQVSFRNNFNFQDGFDGGVLEVSYDHGLTFQDVLDAGGTLVLGGYNGTINSCCGNPWLVGRRGPAIRADLSTPLWWISLTDALSILYCAGGWEVTAAFPAKAGASTTLISFNAMPISRRVRATPQRRARVRRRRDERRFVMTLSVYGNFRARVLPPESRLTSCSVFRQTASMEAEIDCRLQSNSR